MFAARRDQENVVDRYRNAGPIKNGLHQPPKTPAVKPGFQHGRAEGLCGKTSSKAAAPVFATPIGRATRAPLGAKTTNAKGFLLKTPAQPDERVVPSTTKRPRRTQFKVHQAPGSDGEEEDREIEYMPPRGEPIPDLPDDDIWPHDRTFEVLQGENFLRGWSGMLTALDEDSDFDTKYEQALLKEAMEKASHLNKQRSRANEAGHNETILNCAKALPRNATTGAGYARTTTASRAHAATQLIRTRDSRASSKATARRQAATVSTTGGITQHQRLPRSERPSVTETNNHNVDADLIGEPVDLIELEGLEDFQLEQQLYEA